MFERLGEAIYARRRIVVLVGLVVIVLAALWGGSVSKRLTSGGYYDPHSESVVAADHIEHVLGVPASDATVLFVSDKPITDPAVSAGIEGALAALPKSAVQGYLSYGNTHQQRLLSADGHATYATLQLVGNADSSKADSFAAVKASLAKAELPGIKVDYAGMVPLNKEISSQVSKDLRRAESLSLPIVLILLVLIFGSLASAALPLAVGICGIFSAFAVLRFLTIFVNVSIFAENLVTMMGLGLAVDYALFMVSRFREELPRHGDVRRAVARTMATAGRTVAFSGVTIAASAASLSLFPESFLRSMGYGGVAVVLIDVIAALTVLPALLGMLGPKVDALHVPTPWRRRSPLRPDADAAAGLAAPGLAAFEVSQGAWFRLARSVMRRPLLYAVPIIVLLLVMAAPFRNVIWGGYTTKVMPKTSHARVVTDKLAAEFPDNATSPIQVVVEGFSQPVDLEAYVARLSQTPGATGAAVVATKGNNALVQVGFAGDPISQQARSALAHVRDVARPLGSRVLVGGATAFLVDQLDSIGHILPWMLLSMAIAMLILLFLAFGSFVLPVKAIIMNTLSIGASFGAITWIFQGGHLAGLLNFSKLGYLDATDPILMLAVVFGLSMDYEVFLLSRIREEWDASTRRGDPVVGRNERAVAVGLQRSGRIITSAALLLVVVIGLFAMSKVTTVKLLGVGMALAILVDATIVRAMLVPAIMRLLGAVNWWAPRRFVRWWETHGFRESDDVAAAPPTPPPAAQRELEPR